MLQLPLQLEPEPLKNQRLLSLKLRRKNLKQRRAVDEGMILDVSGESPLLTYDQDLVASLTRYLSSAHMRKLSKLTEVFGPLSVQPVLVVTHAPTYHTRPWVLRQVPSLHAR